MKLAVVGSGSIGLYYGACLARVPHEVHFLMRSGLDAATRSGIRIHSADHGIHLARPHVAADPRDIGCCEGVIVAVKTTSNRSLPGLIAPLLGKSTWILTLQNGLGNEDFLASHFGGDRIMGGLCFVCLTRRNPVEVDHVGRGTLSLGEFGRPPLGRTRALADGFHSVGIEARPVNDLVGERWRKLVWNIPFNGLCTAENVGTDRVLADPALLATCRALMDEVRAIAASDGHDIPQEYAKFQIERTRPMGPYLPSTLVDARAGNPIEIESIWGEPLRRAEAAGLSVPHLAGLFRKLALI
ncbi:MAG: 2-dehydropantoate 2-reductase [Verrucomicrobiae bacterium]